MSTEPTLYRFANPTDDEKDQRFVVLDDRGDRVLVREVTLFGNWEVKPSVVYLKSDLVEVLDGDSGGVE